MILRVKGEFLTGEGRTAETIFYLPVGMCLPQGVAAGWGWGVSA